VGDIKICLEEIEFGGVDWVDLAQDRDKWKSPVDTVMNIVEFLSSCIIVVFSRRAQLYGVSYSITIECWA
jgi:hypothetical protein